MNQPLKFLAISGSLRAQSSNSALIGAAARLAPSGVAVEIYEGMGALPHFNPDDDGAGAPFNVFDLRSRVVAADAVILCTPEYVHGLPGSFKNLLDWLVSGGELWGKPVAIIGVTHRGAFANASLVEVLQTLMARISETASVEVPLGSNQVTVADLVADAEIRAQLRAAMAELAGEIREV